MTKIEKPLFRATVAETSELASNSGEIIQKIDFEDQFLKSQGNQLSTTGKKMNNSIASKRSKEMTAEINERDDKRDSAFSAFKFFLRAYMRWDINDSKLTASRLYDLVRNHGLDLDSASFEEESSRLESLINDLKKPENRAALEGLNLIAIAEDLENSQVNFKQTFLKSINAEAGKEDLVAATQLKREAYITLTRTIDYLNAMNMANVDVYGGISAQIDELIGNSNQKIRNRRNN